MHVVFHMQQDEKLTLCDCRPADYIGVSCDRSLHCYPKDTRKVSGGQKSGFLLCKTECGYTICRLSIEERFKDA